MVFGKPLHDLTFQDVVKYCEEGHREGVTLDYKSTNSDSVAKVASAFANTFGGVIIIGVREQNEVPVPPFEGVEDPARIAKSVRDLILSKIYPCVPMKLQVCVDQDTKRGFVVVEITRSELAPHVFDHREIYKRYFDRNNPEKSRVRLAEIEWIETLWRHRFDCDGYVSKRYSEIGELHERIHSYYPAQTVPPDARSLCTFAIIPILPPVERIDIRRLRANIEERKLEAENPELNYYLNQQMYFRTLQDGIYGAFRLGEDEIRDAFKGLLLIRDDGLVWCAFSAFQGQLKIDSQSPIIVDQVTWVSRVLRQFDQFIALSKEIHSQALVSNTVQLSARITNCQGTVGLNPPENVELVQWLWTKGYGRHSYKLPENSIQLSVRGNSQNLLEGFTDFKFALDERLRLAFNC